MENKLLKTQIILEKSITTLQEMNTGKPPTNKERVALKELGHSIQQLETALLNRLAASEQAEALQKLSS